MPSWGRGREGWVSGSKSKYTILTEIQEIFFSNCFSTCCMSLGEFPDTLYFFLFHQLWLFCWGQQVCGALHSAILDVTLSFRENITQNLRLSILFWNFHLNKHIFQNFVSNINILIKGRLMLFYN